jgi:hypothetical protein
MRRGRHYEWTRIAPDLIGMGDSDKIPAGAEPDRYRKKGGACAPPPHKPRGGHGALAGEEESSRSGSLSSF